MRRAYFTRVSICGAAILLRFLYAAWLFYLGFYMRVPVLPEFPKLLLQDFDDMQPILAKEGSLSYLGMNG